MCIEPEHVHKYLCLLTALILVLPKKILHANEQKLCCFLWNGKLDSAAKAIVSWKELCHPKKEGGLGIKKLEKWNRAFMMRHIWNLFAQSGSLWVALSEDSVDWFSLIWYPLAVPKHAFIAWLAMKNALAIGNKLLHWGFTEDVKFVFCRSVIEEKEHMFFECGFSMKIWTSVMQKCGVSNPPIRCYIFGVGSLEE
jgi:hypothetical protein